MCENNIKNRTDSKENILSNYLQDEIFCNDRTITGGNGYNFDTNTHTKYGSHDRNTGIGVPSIKCQQVNDHFAVCSSIGSIAGNGKLDYPIGLITMDEVRLAGGRYDIANSNYYLYTGKNYWTMLPFFHYPHNTMNYEWVVYYNGSTENNITVANYGLRPVINLKPVPLILGGNGTVNSPYVVSMAS